MPARNKSLVLITFITLLLSTSAAEATVNLNWTIFTKESLSGQAISDASVYFRFIDKRTQKITDKTCATDKNGQCTFETLAAGGMIRSPNFDIQYKAEKSGYSKRFTYKSEDLKTENPKVYITMNPLRKFETPVFVDASSNSIVGAKVSFSTRYNDRIESERVTCTTTQDGKCTLAFDGELFTGFVSAPGYYAESVTMASPPEIISLKKIITDLDLSRMESEVAVECTGKESCERAFSLAQIYLLKVSSQKLQIATDTIVETYNPSLPNTIGGRVYKEPIKGDKWRIAIQSYCSEPIEKKKEDVEAIVDRDRDARACAERRVKIYQDFKRSVHN
ncbi:hypothetical protein [Parachitinimonas caeni]|uniref:Carboxypeptidase regulatory-like domain-containing protein n=1 Tax=Parachitinimonas caeni TaxID=3031301 RepID=A0ABT7E087_9NEIS|nr:hypothetical protein [Parachitinimonas caeni]MDK2125715.1 hypothetical protein [Parachitinimonas caeni]